MAAVGPYPILQPANHSAGSIAATPLRPLRGNRRGPRDLRTGHPDAGPGLFHTVGQKCPQNPAHSNSSNRWSEEIRQVRARNDPLQRLECMAERTVTSEPFSTDFAVPSGKYREILTNPHTPPHVATGQLQSLQRVKASSLAALNREFLESIQRTDRRISVSPVPPWKRRPG